MSKYSVINDSAFTAPLGGMSSITESQMWTDGGLDTSTTAFMEAEPSIVANLLLMLMMMLILLCGCAVAASCCSADDANLFSKASASGDDSNIAALERENAALRHVIAQRHRAQ